MSGSGAPENDSDLPHYRDGGPGYRRTDTSKAGARTIAPTAQSIESRLEAAYQKAGKVGATNDEAAAAIGLQYWKARPRTTGLKNRFRIKDSGKRRDSLHGVSSIVWVWVPEAERDGRADEPRPTESQAA